MEAIYIIIHLRAPNQSLSIKLVIFILARKKMLEKSFWTLRLFCLYIVEIWFFKILLCLAKSKYRENFEYRHLHY